MSVKPKQEAMIALVTKTTPILVTLSNSSIQEFCGYYGQIGHGYGECLFLLVS
jgi:hypothetical protein